MTSRVVVNAANKRSRSQYNVAAESGSVQPVTPSVQATVPLSSNDFNYTGGLDVSFVEGQVSYSKTGNQRLMNLRMRLLSNASGDSVNFDVTIPAAVALTGPGQTILNIVPLVSVYSDDSNQSTASGTLNYISPGVTKLTVSARFVANINEGGAVYVNLMLLY